MEQTIKLENGSPQYSVKLEIKQELDDVPDFVGINDLSEPQNETKLRKEYNLHQCFTCFRRYRKADYLRIHRVIHDSERFCSGCDETFTDKRKFVLHVNDHIRAKMKKDKEEECVCSFCQKKFGTRRRLQLHIRVHTGERPYKCDICGESFKLSGALKDHQVTHSGIKEHVCEICKGEYTTSSSLNRHKKRVHKTVENFDCKECGTKFLNTRSFNCHQKKVHSVKKLTGVGVANFRRECQKCGSIFNHPDTYEKHKKILCNKNIMYECLLCGDLQRSLLAYAEHKRIHMQYTKKEYEATAQEYDCKICSKSFPSVQIVFRHLHVHMEKTEQCHLCYDYYSKYGLKIHMMRCHKALECKFCHKFKLGKAKLFRHYNKHHSTIARKFSCNICKRKYMTKKALYIHHKIVHDKNRSHLQCNLCGSNFFSSADREKHMTSSHMVNKKYHCVSCDVDFKNRRDILRHNSQHTQIKTDNFSSPTKSQMSKSYWIVSGNTPIKCPTCNKTVKTCTSYKLHNKLCNAKIKIEARKLKCKICNRILYNSSSYKKHRHQHSNVSFNCKFCNVVCKNSVQLRKHRRIYH